MSKLVVLITAQAEAAYDIAVAWKESGAPGATFLDGRGLQSLRQASASMEILTGMTSMLDILRQTQIDVVLVLSLVEDDVLPDRLVTVAESILGDMQAPDKGVLFVVDVERALGVSRRSGD